MRENLALQARVVAIGASVDGFADVFEPSHSIAPRACTRHTQSNNARPRPRRLAGAFRSPHSPIVSVAKLRCLKMASSSLSDKQGSPSNRPNPTLFQKYSWPLRDSIDPLHGWRPRDVENCSYGPARNEIYGSLVKHLKTPLISWTDRFPTNSTSTSCTKMQ